MICLPKKSFLFGAVVVARVWRWHSRMHMDVDQSGWRDKKTLKARRPAWEKSTRCRKCKTSFTLYVRRHHCRACGGSFCSTHVPHKLEMPYLGHFTPVLTCETCYRTLLRSRESSSTSARRRRTGSATGMRGSSAGGGAHHHRQAAPRAIEHSGPSTARRDGSSRMHSQVGEPHSVPTGLIGRGGGPPPIAMEHEAPISRMLLLGAQRSSSSDDVKDEESSPMSSSPPHNEPVPSSTNLDDAAGGPFSRPSSMKTDGCGADTPSSMDAAHLDDSSPPNVPHDDVHDDDVDDGVDDASVKVPCHPRGGGEEEGQVEQQSATTPLPPSSSSSSFPPLGSSPPIASKKKNVMEESPTRAIKEDPITPHSASPPLDKDVAEMGKKAKEVVKEDNRNVDEGKEEIAPSRAAHAQDTSPKRAAAPQRLSDASASHHEGSVVGGSAWKRMREAMADISSTFIKGFTASGRIKPLRRMLFSQGPISILSPTLKCVQLNVAVLLGSYVLFHWVMFPYFHSLLEESIPSCCVLGFVEGLLSTAFTVCWMAPLLFISVLKTNHWYDKIAQTAFGKFKEELELHRRRRHQQRNQTSVKHGSRPIGVPMFLYAEQQASDAIYRWIVILWLLTLGWLASFLSYISPALGIIAYFIILCISNGFYCSEYRLIGLRERVHQRLERLETCWAYFSGFGFVITIVGFYWTPVVNYALTACMYCLWIPVAMFSNPKRLKSAPRIRGVRVVDQFFLKPLIGRIQDIPVGSVLNVMQRQSAPVLCYFGISCIIISFTTWILTCQCT